MTAPSHLRHAKALKATTTVDLDCADKALLRILRACAESAERYDTLDLEEREGEHGALMNDVIRETCRARKALGLES